MRQRVSTVLDTLPLEYVTDEVVRRLAGHGSGELSLRYRDGFVVGRRVRNDKPTKADLRRIGVAYRKRLRDLEIERNAG